MIPYKEAICPLNNNVDAGLFFCSFRVNTFRTLRILCFLEILFFSEILGKYSIYRFKSIIFLCRSQSGTNIKDEIFNCAKYNTVVSEECLRLSHVIQRCVHRHTRLCQWYCVIFFSRSSCCSATYSLLVYWFVLPLNLWMNSL